MDRSRSTLALVGSAGLTVAAAMAAPRLGGPDGAILLAVLFASLTSSIAGFAFSAVCGSLLLHLSVDHVRMVGLMLACSIANQGVMVLMLRRDIEWSAVAVFVLGGLFGVPLGVWLLLHLDRRQFGEAVGAVLLAYGAYVPLARPFLRQRRSIWIDAAVGFAGGVTGASAALPSVPPTVWSQIRGLDKRRQRALCQPFILAMQLASLATLLALSPPGGGGPAMADLLCLPAGLFGTLIGMDCYAGLSKRGFALSVSAVLIVSGLNFLLSS